MARLSQLCNQADEVTSLRVPPCTCLRKCCAPCLLRIQFQHVRNVRLIGSSSLHCISLVPVYACFSLHRWREAKSRQNVQCFLSWATVLRFTAPCPVLRDLVLPVLWPQAELFFFQGLVYTPVSGLSPCSSWPCSAPGESWSVGLTVSFTSILESSVGQQQFSLMLGQLQNL